MAICLSDTSRQLYFILVQGLAFAVVLAAGQLEPGRVARNRAEDNDLLCRFIWVQLLFLKQLLLQQGLGSCRRKGACVLRGGCGLFVDGSRRAYQHGGSRDGLLRLAGSRSGVLLRVFPLLLVCGILLLLPLLLHPGEDHGQHVDDAWLPVDAEHVHEVACQGARQDGFLVAVGHVAQQLLSVLRRLLQGFGAVVDVDVDQRFDVDPGGS